MTYAFFSVVNARYLAQLNMRRLSMNRVDLGINGVLMSTITSSDLIGNKDFNLDIAPS